MRRARAWLCRLAGLFARKRHDREMAAELESHLAHHIDDNLRAGMTPAEARRQALLKLGGLEQTKERYRERRGIPFLEALWRDLRYSARVLRKSPSFVAIAVATMALGIGANTALFSVVDAVLINPLPYWQPGRLVAIYSHTQSSATDGCSYLNFLDWQRSNHVFSSMAAFREENLNLTGIGEPERVKGEMISADFFPLLGVKPVVGRVFTEREDRPGGTPVALISEGFWKRKFGGAPNVAGKTLTLNDDVYTIVGVIPAGFRYPSRNFHNSEVYTPIGQWSDPTFRDRRVSMGMDAVGRLVPGVSLAQARAQMEAIAAHLAEQYPNADRRTSITLIPLKQDVVGGIQPFLLLLVAAVGFVLLIACVNVANLMLARSFGRARDFAIRAALGASRGSVIRQLITESLVLALSGGLLGLGLADWGTHAALRMLPAALPRSGDVQIDASVLLFTLLVSLFAGILFGLAPALKVSRGGLHEALKEGGRGGSGTRHKTQRILVVVEMALAVVLLVGAGLMIRSLAKIWSVNPGFDPRQVLTFSLSSPRSLGTSPDGIRAAFRRIRRQVAAAPGVEAASLMGGSLPMSGESDMRFWIAGEPRPASDANMKTALFYAVQPEYFQCLRIPLERGRLFTDRDDASSLPVVVIDQRFAHLYFGRQDPIGRRIHVDVLGRSLEIVGIVGHVKQWGLDSEGHSQIQAQMYLPLSQIPNQFLPLVSRGATIVARTRAAPLAQVPAVRHAIEQLNGELVMYNSESMDEIISDSLAARRFSMILLAVFAGIALALACVGIYGVVSYLVGQRLHEMGIRMALGAGRGDVLRLVLGESARLTIVGVGVGLAAALGLTRLMSRMIFGVSAHDPITLLAVCGLLLLVALVASFVPARRMMRVDPLQALRHE